MALTKTRQEIKLMKEGGRRLALVLGQIIEEVKPGLSLNELEKRAVSLIKGTGGRPSFKMVESYRWATCLNVNQGVVHGVPNDYTLKEGDLLSLDLGLFYRGFHTDMARTLRVRGQGSKIKNQKEEFLRVGIKALSRAISVAKSGNRVGHVSKAIEGEIKKAGYRPIEALTGHGIGRQLHEEPAIPCVLKQNIGETEALKEGMVLAIEVIYAQKGAEIIIKNDGWTIETKDKSLAALFENTVLVSSSGGQVLTDLPLI